jgi:hypothetical protein
MRTRGIVVVAAFLALVAATVAAGASSSHLPPAKQAMSDKLAAERSAARDRAGSVNKASDVGRPVSSPEPKAQAAGIASGIGTLVADADTLRPPGHPDDTFTNSWTVSSASLNVDVWAGARGSDPNRGFLLVVVWNANRTSVISGGEFEPAQGRGALRIRSATGTDLALTSADGGTMTFDVAGLRFK